MSDDLDLAVTWGDQFQIALQGMVDSICHQDAYEVWSVLGADLTVAALESLTGADLQAMVDAANAIFECSSITVAQIGSAVQATLANC